MIVTDLSSLWDFADSDSIEHYQRKIEEVFGVDVSSIKQAQLVEIAKKIESDR